jgi:hypothetical protein
MLPIRDNPDYSRLSGSAITPSRTSSDTRSSEVGSIAETQTGLTPMQQNQQNQQPQSQTNLKRQPRKLTKSRGNSEVNIEKPKAVLMKKGPQQQSNSTLSLVDGDGRSVSGFLNKGGENTPYEDGKPGSLVSQSSSTRESKDKLMPG